MKKNYYFEQYKAQTKLLTESVSELKKLTVTFDWFGLVSALDALSENCVGEGKICNEISLALEKEFLPPIERGDALLLSQEICACACAVHLVLGSFYCAGISGVDGRMRDFAEMIFSLNSLLDEAIDAFSGFAKTKNAVNSFRRISELEHGGNELYIRAYRELIDANQRSATVKAMLQVYGAMNDCCAAYSKTAKTGELIIIRNM